VSWIRLALVFLLLAATVPWLATGGPSGSGSLPGWLLYAFLGTLLLAIVLGLLLQFLWDSGQGGSRD